MTSNIQAADIEGIIFDMGDILYDATGWRRWLADYLSGLGIDIDYPRLVEGWEKALVPVYLGKEPYWDAFANFVLQLGFDPDGVEDLKDLASNQGKQLSQGHKPFPGVAEGLKTLKEAGLKLAILSDNEATHTKIQAKLIRFELADYFDAVVSSIDIGAVKPMPEAFQAAHEALGLERDKAAFVAHDVDELEGSLEYGLFTVAYNYTPGAPATVYAENFEEVVSTFIAD